MAMATRTERHDWLIARLAQYLDFARDRSSGLEEYFYRRDPWATAENHTSSSVVIDDQLGVGTTYTKPAMEHLKRMLASHEFTVDQREILIRRERRKGIWESFLKTQDVHGDDLTTALARSKSPEMYGYVLDRPRRFRLAERNDLAELAANADTASRVRAVANRLVPSLDASIAPLLETLIYTDVWYDHATPLLLIEQRAELHDVVLEVADVATLAQMAASPFLVDLERQRSVAGLDTHFVRRADLRQWAYQRSAVLRGLAANPRCHREVLEEILVHLHEIEGNATLIAQITARVADFDEHPTYTGDFATESDPEVLAWLSNLCFESHNGSVQSLRGEADATGRLLVSNPHFMAHPSNESLPAYLVSRLLCESDDRWKSPEERSRPAGGTATQSPWPPKLEVQRPFEAVSYVQHMLGSNPSLYETLTGLANEWSGTTAELVECAARLRA